MEVIYSTIILFLISAFSLLPFIHMDIGVRSQGLIRPVTKVVQLSAPVSGHIQMLNVSENSLITRGDVFAILDRPEISERLRFNERRQQQLISFLTDLALLQRSNSRGLITSVELDSPRYRQAWQEFRQNLLNHQHEIDQINRQLEREKILFERDAISESALDEIRFSFQSATNRYKLFVEQQQNQWKLDEVTLQDELNQLQSEHIQLRQELSRNEIRSPITGTVQNTAGIFQNSFVYANQVLGEISPDTTLIAESYVSPSDIGLLRKGMPVRIQIDAYNYNQWGIVTGTIESISMDIMMIENRPVFKVRSTLDQSYLQLQNGFVGDIKKGMTFQGRFIVTRRSLFQLLYDKVDDWLNPEWAENHYMVQSGNS